MGLPWLVAAEGPPLSFKVDQGNDRAAPRSGYVLPKAAPVGQSFVPTLPHLNVVELQMNSQSSAAGGVAVVRIRSGSVTGAILGVSEPAIIPPVMLPVDVVHFDFSAPVPLEPGSPHVIEVVATAGTLGVFGARISEDSPPGTAIAFGTEQPRDALWFREGISYPESVERSSWGRAPRSTDR